MFNRRPKPPTPNYVAARRRPSLDFSLNGLIYCCIMMFMGLAAINSGVNLLYGIFGLMIGILIVAAAMSRRVLKRLAVHRVLPDHGIVGLPITISYQFNNRKRFWPSLSVTAAELDGAEGFTRQPQGYLLHVAAGMSATIPVEATPVRRGIHHFDRFQISTSFPFGFVRRASVNRQADHLLVYPAIGKVDSSLLRLCRAAEHSGAAMRPEPGGQDEFYGVKEHRPGENPRQIYWRRSARTAGSGVLIAKEMTHAAPPRLMLLVDTWLEDRSAAEVARVEKTIAMAASMVSAAEEQELSVGLLAWSDGWKRIDPSRGKRHRSDLLAALARLRLNVSQDMAKLLVEGLPRSRQGATAILFTPRKIPAGLDARYRGRLLVVPADSTEAALWVRWDRPVDFAACAPNESVQGQ